MDVISAIPDAPRSPRPFSKADAVTEAVRQRILFGIYRPGEAIREAALQAEFAVSNAPVRSALQRLAAEGVVTRSAQHGARVTDLSEGELLQRFEYFFGPLTESQSSPPSTWSRRSRQAICTRPTPCAGWHLVDLLAHMTVQHHGFAASARGNGGDLTLWDPASVVDRVSRDPSGTYAAAATDVLEAFSADDALTAQFALPEFGPGATFPGEMAIGFHFVDYVVHGWDVARTVDASFELPGDVIAAALPLALAVPHGDFRRTAGAPSRPPSTAPSPRRPLTESCCISGVLPRGRPHQPSVADRGSEAGRA